MILGQLRRGLEAAVFLLALALATVAVAGPAPQPITVFAAASLKNAVEDVARAFSERTGIPVRTSYAASSAIARQIEQGAPADVFISADTDWMDYLQQRHLIATGSRVELLANHLALIAPAASPVHLRIAPGMPLAAALGAEGRLALAGPDVPAGRYAQAALTALAVWPRVEARLARGESVRATLAFVARGETPLGVVYDTDAMIEPKVRIVGLFPESSHPPIRYPAAVVSSSTNAAAPAFLAFLRSPPARAIFHRYGFITLR